MADSQGVQNSNGESFSLQDCFLCSTRKGVPVTSLRGRHKSMRNYLESDQTPLLSTLNEDAGAAHSMDDIPSGAKGQRFGTLPEPLHASGLSRIQEEVAGFEEHTCSQSSPEERCSQLFAEFQSDLRTSTDNAMQKLEALQRSVISFLGEDVSTMSTARTLNGAPDTSLTVQRIVSQLEINAGVTRIDSRSKLSKLLDFDGDDDESHVELPPSLLRRWQRSSTTTICPVTPVSLFSPKFEKDVARGSSCLSMMSGADVHDSLDVSDKRGRGAARKTPSRHVEMFNKGRELHTRWRELYMSNTFHYHEMGEVTSDVWALQRTDGASRTERSLRRSNFDPLFWKQGTVQGCIGYLNWCIACWLHCATGQLDPHSAVYLFWDTLGMIVVSVETFTIPISIAWDWSFATDTTNYHMTFAILLYWLTDILISFRLGFVGIDGHTVYNRKRIVEKYLWTWFAPDVIFVFLDLFILYVAPGGHSAQHKTICQCVRAARVLRCLKIVKVKFVMRELFGRTLAFTVTVEMVKTIASSLCISHYLACMWFAIGRFGSQHQSINWLDSAVPEWQDRGWFDMYTKSLYWVVGQILAAEPDSTVRPRNQSERVFTLLMIYASLFVMAVIISKITNTYAEISRRNAELEDVKMRLHDYMRFAGVKPHTATRIVRFALHSHEQRIAVSVRSDILSLLSKDLAAELTVFQRQRHLCIHPLFLIISNKHAVVFAAICEAFQHQIYADGDFIFHCDTWSTRLYINTYGTYKLGEEMANNGVSRSVRGISTLDRDLHLFEKPTWFCEISLFAARVLHATSLRAVSFSDMLTIDGDAFAECTKQSPACIAYVCRYANEYLNLVSDTKMCKVTDHIPCTVAENACKAVEEITVDIKLASQEVPRDIQAQFVDNLKSSTLSPEIIDGIPSVFGELDQETGVYANVKFFDERLRALASMRSILWLAKDDYESFTRSQGDKKMSFDLWKKWQSVIKWIDADPEMLHAVLVFLAIRGLGKVKSFNKLLPYEDRTPEKTVIFLMNEAPRVVPSVEFLSRDMFNMVARTFDLYGCCNFAQLLQAENTPRQVQFLQMITQEEPDEMLHKFYIMAAVGMMCGLLGNNTLEGSLFLNQDQGLNVLTGIRCLRAQAYTAPQAIFWGYISSRAQQLGLPAENQEDLVIARLACLTRSSSSADLKEIRKTLLSMSAIDRTTLVDHFLADGIYEKAIVFTYLPLYLTNCKQNRVVGLRRAFDLLLLLIEALRAEGIADAEDMTTNVRLQELARFAKDVMNPRIFLLCSVQWRLSMAGRDVEVLINSEHWQRATLTLWTDDPNYGMFTLMNSVNRKIEKLSADVENIDKANRTTRFRSEWFAANASP